jgi:hypothetical protein
MDTPGTETMTSVPQQGHFNQLSASKTSSVTQSNTIDNTFVDHQQTLFYCGHGDRVIIMCIFCV